MHCAPFHFRPSDPTHSTPPAPRVDRSAGLATRNTEPPQPLVGCGGSLDFDAQTARHFRPLFGRSRLDRRLCPAVASGPKSVRRSRNFMPNLLHANAVRNVLHCDARGFAGLIPHQVVTPNEPALRIPDPLLDQRRFSDRPGAPGRAGAAHRSSAGCQRRSRTGVRVDRTESPRLPSASAWTAPERCPSSISLWMPHAPETSHEPEKPRNSADVAPASAQSGLLARGLPPCVVAQSGGTMDDDGRTPHRYGPPHRGRERRVIATGRPGFRLGSTLASGRRPRAPETIRTLDSTGCSFVIRSG